MNILQLFSWSGLLNGIFSLGFGIFIALRDWKSKTNQLFLTFALAIAFWSFSYWRWLTFTTDGQGALLWTKILDFGALWIPITFFHWLDSAFGFSRQQKYIKYVVVVGYVVTLVISFFALTPLFVKAVRPELSFPFWPKPGILYHVYFFGLYVGLLLIYGPFLLHKRYKQTFTEKKRGLMYIYLGIVLGAVGGATNFLLWYDIPIAPYGNFLVPVWVFFLGYATVRYHVFGPKVITTEFLVFLIWSFLLSRIFLAAELINRIIDIVLFLFILIIGFLLIGSVRREIKQKEQLDNVNAELKDLNEHLQEKVEEQTKETRKAYELEKKAYEELKQLNAAKDQFILITQHHLRTPLTIIKGYLLIILSKYKNKIEPKVAEYIEKISSSAERLNQIVNEFLDITQFQVGKGLLNFQKTSLYQLIKEIFEEFKPELEKKKLFTKVIPEEKYWPLIQVDPEKLKKALFNIIDNAIKYTQNGGITITLQRQDKKVILSIQDTGMGLSKEEIKHLFAEVFERGEEAQKIFPTGRGIGLYVTASIIKAHQGRVWAESDGENKGTRFVIELLI